MTDEKIIKLAKQAKSVGMTVCFDSKFGRADYQSISCSVPQLAEFARLVRNEALEEAAKKVTSTFGLASIASTIRAMKEKA